MANEFIIRKGFKSQEDSQITGSISLSGSFKDQESSPGTAGQVLSSTVSGSKWVDAADSSAITGAGTTGTITKWTTGGSVIGDSIITEAASAITVTGDGTFTNSVTADQGIFNSTANTYADGSLILRDLNGANPMYLTSVVGNLAISNGGAADHLTISSGGNVGIGTSSPISGFKLDVQGGDFRVGDDANQGFEAGYSAGSGNVFIQGYNRGTSSFVNMILNNALTISSGGDATFSGIVGINGSTTANVPLTATTSSGYEDVAYFKSAGTNIKARINLIPTGTGDGVVNATANDLVLQTGGADRLTISSAGAIIQDTSSNTSTYFQIRDRGTTLGYFGSADSLLNAPTTNTQFAIRSEDDFAIATGGGTRRLTISSGGEIQVGENAALVFGTNNATDPYIQAASSGDELFFGRANGFQMAIRSDNVVDFKTGIRFINGGNTTLDAYEEGSWTPTIDDLNNISSVVITKKNYTLIGNLVTCAFEFSGTISSSSSETYFSFTTPFTIASISTPFVGHVGFFIGTGANRFGVASVYEGTNSNTKTFIFIAANQINTSGAFSGARMTFTYQKN